MLGDDGVELRPGVRLGVEVKALEPDATPYLMIVLFVRAKVHRLSPDFAGISGDDRVFDDRVP